MRNNNAAIYARVSTAQQEDGTSLETQVDACLLRAAADGRKVELQHILREQASGADSDRRLLTQLRQLVRQGDVGTVLIYSPDRLSRNPLDLMVISEEFSEAGARLIFVQGPSGTSPEDKLVRYILGYVGEKEREFITERTMRGKVSTAKSGRMPVGTGKGLYGYNYDPVAKKRTVIETEAAVVKKIFQRASAGVSLYQIALGLNADGIPTKTGSRWHPLTVKRMVTNQAYIGVDYYGKTRSRKKRGGGRVTERLAQEQWVRVEDFTPPIIEETTFGLVQTRLSAPSQRKGPTRYLLTGFVLCGDCGSPVVGSSLHEGYRYYSCRATRPTTLGPATCRAQYIPAGPLETAVWSRAKAILDNPEIIMEELRRQSVGLGDNFTEEMTRLRREIHHCQDQERRLVTLYMYGEIDDPYIRQHSGPLKLLREGLEAELAQMEQQQTVVRDLEKVEVQLQAFAERMRSNLDDLDHEGRRGVLSMLRVKASATKDQVVIRGVVEFPEQGDISCHCTNIGMTTWT